MTITSPQYHGIVIFIFNLKMRYLILLLLNWLGSSCNNNGNPGIEKKDSSLGQTVNKENKPGKMPVGKSPAGEAACYMQVIKRDTIVMLIEKNENNISGRLSFDNYEKDGSSGTVLGWQDGDVMKLVYSFVSEGMNSIMEVFFKKKGDGLVRGVGEMESKGDTVYFLHPELVDFPDDAVMNKLDCEQVPEKYK